MPLRRHSAVPLYRQLETALLGSIESGEFGPGERLPPETALAREWKVNRLTVRQAIAELARSGHVRVRQGAGTYVAEPPLVVEIDLPPLPTMEAETSSSEGFAAQGHEQAWERLVDTAVGGESAEVRSALESGTAALRRIDTVMGNGETLWGAASYWFDDARFPGLADQTGEGTHVYSLMRDRFGVRTRYAWRTLGVGAASAADADVLDVPSGSPMWHREGVNVDEDGRPTLYLSRRMRGDRIRYLMRYDTHPPDQTSSTTLPVT